MSRERKVNVCTEQLDNSASYEKNTCQFKNRGTEPLCFLSFWQLIQSCPFKPRAFSFSSALKNLSKSNSSNKGSFLCFLFFRQSAKYGLSNQEPHIKKKRNTISSAPFISWYKSSYLMNMEYINEELLSHFKNNIQYLFWLFLF